MSRYRANAPHSRKTLLALAVSAMLAPAGSWALDLVQAPPGTVQPYVRPNVIISIDDSGSMNYRIDQETASGATGDVEPPVSGIWPPTSRRINVLKYALRSIFETTHAKYDATLMPDQKIRLAWQSMNGNNSTPKTLPGAPSTTPTKTTNSMQLLDSTHRTNFLNFVTALTPNSSTPSHGVLKKADDYMRAPLAKDGPWASVPGTSPTPYLGCRRNYHIFMTDGRWNGTQSGGDQDNNTQDISLPNTTPFGSSTTANRPYNNLYHDPHLDMLADWTFKSWSNQLQTAVDPNGITGLQGSPQPGADYDAAPATENFGKDTTGKDAVLQRFWNPRYNPATWPHMVTYTIGLSKMAYTWPGVSGATAANKCNTSMKIRAPGQTCDASNNASFNLPLMLPFNYDAGQNGSLPDLITGNLGWPDLKTGGEPVRSLDLWHAALNGRGRFYAVEKGEDLATAFRDIFKQINSATDPDLTSTATSGANSTRNDVGKFTGAYEPKNFWKGFVTAETVKTDGTTVPTPGWGNKSTSDKLDALTDTQLANRLILSTSDKWVSTAFQGGVPFQWANDETNLSTSQKLWLQKNISGVDEGNIKGQQRLDYIRGVRTLEGTDPSGYGTATPFRQRKSRQGDIMNSVVWYTGAPSNTLALNGYADFMRCHNTRPPMIYVGGNDGMLHGFTAADGAEKLAYVPQGVIPSLSRLTDPTYNNKHRFFVDGSAMTGDIDTDSSTNINPANPCTSNDWRTMLVGTLGAGGKGYFVLDVTNPTTAAVASGAPGPAFTETKAAQLVVLDRTRSTEVGAAPDCSRTGISAAEQTACFAAEAEDKDIGNITARPVQSATNPMLTTQITRMNNNRWAAVLGNGYNSANQRPVLLIQYLDGAKELKRIQTTTDAIGSGKAADNGLSAPRLVDLNGDGTPDVAYAGDNQGNLWKFDLTSYNPSNWDVAFGKTPLYSATGPASLGSTSRTKLQPITAAPTVTANDRMMTVGTGSSAKNVAVGGMMVAFGTGRNVDVYDPSNRDVQSVYSVLDNTRYRTVSSPLGKRVEVHPGAGTCPAGPNCVPAPSALGSGVTTAKLAQQKITEIGTGNFATVDIVDDLNLGTWANYNGWYLDLPAVGERLLKPMEFYDGSNILTMFSQVPAKGSNVDPDVESCESVTVDGERQYRTLINIMDGKRPTVQIVDMNGDGLYNAITDQGVSRAAVSKGSHNLITKGNRIIDIDTKNKQEILARMPEQTLRPSWRQVK